MGLTRQDFEEVDNRWAQENPEKMKELRNRLRPILQHAKGPSAMNIEQRLFIDTFAAVWEERMGGHKLGGGYGFFAFGVEMGIVVTLQALDLVKEWGYTDD